MPWRPKEAERHTKKANTDRRKRMWAEAANSVYSRTGDEGRAVRAGNAAVSKDVRKHAERRQSHGA